MQKRYIYGLALVDTGNLVRGTLVSSEFWDSIGGKIIEKSDTRGNTAEKGGKRITSFGERRNNEVLSGRIRPDFLFLLS